MERSSTGVQAVRHLRIAPNAAEPFAEVDGRSPEIRKLKQHMACVARDADVSVLVVGESGTGKERVARAIHRASPRAAAPFVVVNCGGLTPTLVEDELFGHVRGAFTGAVDSRPGPFERASGGTVFLDEVGDLALDVQVKLLRAIQQRTIQRLGGTHETSFDVRIVAATNVDLAAAMSRGRFREDLYYRLKVYELRVPALRRRGSADVDSEVLDRFGRHDWPGNVRELENTLEYMVVRAGPEPVLTVRHLPEDFGGSALRRSAAVLPSARDVVAALERNHGKPGRAAADLGVSRHQLYRLLKRRAAPSP
jgi:DNA-binding NtrC family response regulator